MTSPPWIIMPVLAGPEVTVAALADCLTQTVPARILVVNQGVDDGFRHQLEQYAEEYEDRLLVWSHVPPLPSLSATWNRALDAAWEAGAEMALVVNNDVRLRRDTIERLQTVLQQEAALFVSAVGVDEQSWGSPLESADLRSRGGPDFSCFLIARYCHERFRFDEGFIPAFCEDLDYHRRLMLAGEGGRIFSVNVPYLHLASHTLKTLAPGEAQRIRAEIETISRGYYREKWGGSVNEETFLLPFGAPSGWTRTDGSATTPYLQAHPEEATIRPDRQQFLGGQGNYRPLKGLHGIPDDGLGLTSGPDDGYRGIGRRIAAETEASIEELLNGETSGGTDGASHSRQVEG